MIYKLTMLYIESLMDKMLKISTEPRVFIVSTTKEVGDDFNEFLDRMARMLEANSRFGDHLSAIDEEAPKAGERWTLAVEKLIMAMMAVYPNQEQLEVDIQTLKQVRVHLK